MRESVPSHHKKLHQKMDLSPSPFWIKKHQQGSVFDFKNIPVENHTDGDSDDDSSEVIIGKIVYILLNFFACSINLTCQLSSLIEFQPSDGISTKARKTLCVPFFVSLDESAT